MQAITTIRDPLQDNKTKGDTTTTTKTITSPTTTAATTTTTTPRETTKPEVVPTTTAENKFPLSARLPFFVDQWRKVTNNSWVLRVVEEGYKLQFNPSPPQTLY